MQQRIGVVVVCLLLTACGGQPASEPAPPPGGASEEAALSGPVTVFAAASLTEAFNEAKPIFEAANPGSTLSFNFAGSETLARQIEQGAPADVFASASGKSMEIVTGPGLVAGEPQKFAGNLLSIAVEPGNPQRIEGLTDLARPGLNVILAAPDVPAGQYAAEALDGAGVRVRPVSLETDVKGVVSKVALGEADAGVVYVSDVVAGGGDVQGVDIPEQDNVPATYPVAVLAAAPNAAGGSAFVEFLLSPDGQALLAKYGFTTAA